MTSFFINKRNTIFLPLFAAFFVSTGGCDTFNSSDNQPPQANSRITIDDQHKLNDATSSFLADRLSDGDIFGVSLTRLGDLDGDGQTNLAVGAPRDHSFTPRGAVYVLDLQTDGSIADGQIISDVEGGFSGSLDDGDRFGDRVTFLGDLDGDGAPTLAVGAKAGLDNSDPGTLWLLELNDDGTVLNHQKITENTGGFEGSLTGTDKFGSGLAALGDIDGDGKLNLAVGADGTNDGGNAYGAVWILDLNADGTVASEQKISQTAGDFGGDLGDREKFGFSAASLDDLEGDGTHELAIGAQRDDDGGGRNSNRGAVWILSLNPDGTVASEQKISDTAGGFGGTLADGDHFGVSVGAAGDLNSDGTTDLLVGAPDTDGGGTARGAAWLLYLREDGTVVDERKISDARSGFDGMLADEDKFGRSIASLKDLNGDGVTDFAIGAHRSDGGGTDRGATWILYGEEVSESSSSDK